MFNLKIFLSILSLSLSLSFFLGPSANVNAQTHIRDNIKQDNIKIDTNKLSKLKKDLEVRSGGLVSDLFNRRMERIGGEISAENYKRAIELIQSLIESTKSNRFENALAQQNLGVTYLQSGNNKKGIEALNKALDANALNYEQTLNVYYTLAQVEMSVQNYKEALQKLEEWFYLAPGPTPDALILKAGLYSEMKKPKKALEFVEEAFKLTKKPREQWLAFAAGLYYENGNLSRAAQMFKQLTEINPKQKSYWKQLAGIYVALNKFDDALTSLVLAQKLGHLTEESDILNICNLYNYNDIPVNCARILEDALNKKTVKDLDRVHNILSRAYIQAREPLKAIASLNYLSRAEKTGKFEAQIGFIHYQLQDWTKAQKSFADALKKGGLKDKKAEIILSKAISEYQNKKYADAINTLTELKTIEGHMDQANAWLSEINKQRNVN